VVDDHLQELLGFKFMRRLNLIQCEKITSAGVASILQGLHHLEALELKACRQVTSTCFATLRQQSQDGSYYSIAGAKNLQILNLAECIKVDDKAMECIAFCFSSLVTLNVRDCDKITDAGIGLVISSCPHLSVLNLKGLILTDVTVHLVSISSLL
jgi:hypothetical protein